ncbi:hypothetical protein AB0F11_22760 [Streptomyces sp. NPDC032472]|uniref:hypothetical protein n=1 Tax=Streptomyces sp. NPDC032472 TaxID=3155018 RepID=UPI0033DFC6DD
MNDTAEAEAEAEAAAPSVSLVWPAVLAILLTPVALMFGGLAPMATDGCGPDNCSASLDAALAAIAVCWQATLFATPALLLAALPMPRTGRYAAARRVTAWCAVLPPAAVVLMVLGLPAG